MKLVGVNRRVHYWLSAFVAVPLLVMTVSGLLLQFKKHLPWVQPTELRGTHEVPAVSFERILEACAAVPEAGVKSWEDINRIDVRPSRGILKVTTQKNWEIQIDSASGAVLQVAYRRSDVIEAIHDGSWFHGAVKYGLFIPAGVSLFVLWLTGMVLFVVPYAVRARRARHSR